MKKSSRRDLQKFISGFLVTVARCIPHHLNEEIFQLTEEVIELTCIIKEKDHDTKSSQKREKEYQKERKLHVKCLVEALTDKYTMRSKAHKRLTKYFIQKIVLD